MESIRRRIMSLRKTNKINGGGEILPIKKINPMEKDIMKHKKMQELQNKIIGQRNNIALAKGVIPDPRKRQFIKKGILGVIAGIGIAIFSKVAHAGGIIFKDDSTLFGNISARAFNSADISINNSTDTKLTFNSERFDTDTIHSTSSNTGRLTATTAGLYSISSTVSFAIENDSTLRALTILLNGSTVIARVTHPALNGIQTELGIHTFYNLSATDYVELSVHQLSGGALNVLAAVNTSPEFSMVKVG